MNFLRPIHAPARAGNAFACENCSRRLHPKRGSRRQRFCCASCRNMAFRAKKWGARYDGLGPLRSVRNNAVASMACNGHLARRAPRICGPAHVVGAELIVGRKWKPVTSPDGITVYLADRGVRW
jgi:hypothetical protein